MNGLAIDTSTYVMGVAVMKDGELAGEFMTNMKKNHSLRLMPAIRKLLEEVDLTPEQLNRIVVAEGPGSYTGVRIGVTTAKTLAWSLNIPVVGVSSLEIIAQHGRYTEGVISPFIDARRGQVYTGLYQSKNGIVKRVRDDQIIQHEDWLQSLREEGENVFFASPDMDKHVEGIKRILGEAAMIGGVTEMAPRPGELIKLGMEKEVDVSTHEFSPNYIRMAEAETKWLAAKKEGQS
ncbi:tRNA (adenosine(37)-N6)-threonylcarbamoyltransferase complex dimerization subunit type 1 TsaB [Evansella cellulosilytica]|uniref:Peptidase M22 glycoprotease n=1 Tax=Evansella cellulosilytica (strain ATCC 21833 / DSM 2522 / FERM P-1141 / JCM 9156 / N-4) TaxID=649639 RepID=E6TVT5_EVAC2|nr:tRNA (adenosine(37)-N6)-threonylcarbamoyltransferase complex dimerization subunit type 1 TsaB [Evansella cellulosilytica]ADU28644.1 peptidase M22 glycoprotease [Evansella cellulosilytica DSM 2522]